MRMLPILAAVVLSAPPQIAATQAVVTPIVESLPAASAIAIKPTGQSILVIDDASRSIESIDVADPSKRSTAVSAFAPDVRPLSVACIDSVTVAVVVRQGPEFSLRTFRLGPPGEAADSRKPAQQITLARVAEAAGEMDGAASERAVRIVVSPSRNWLVVSGLPAADGPLARAPIAGSRVGAVTSRNCPSIEPAETPPAAVISPAEELVVFAESAAAEAAGGVVCSIYSPVGARRMLELDTGLPRVRGGCYSKDNLFVIAGAASDETRPEGLWRLESTLENRRQAIRPVCVARIDAPIAIAPLSGGRILVVHGATRRTISVVEP